MTDSPSIQKHEEIIETAIVTYVDPAYTEGEFTGRIVGQEVTITIANIDGSTSVRVPLPHLERVRSMLDHIAVDLQ